MREEKDLNEALDINEKQSNIERGLSMFFMNPKIIDEEENPEKFYFYYDKLPEKYKNNLSLARDVLRFRNKLLIILSFEILSSIFGFALFGLRKNAAILIINLIVLLVCFIGIISVIYMADVGIITYSLITVSLPFSFIVFQIFDYYMTRHPQSQQNTFVTESLFLGLLSIPYVYDFICGCLNLYFISLIGKFVSNLKKKNNEDSDENQRLNEEEIKNLKEKYSEQLLEEEFKKRENLKGNSEDGNINLLCIICCTNPRSVICNPCHDLLMCRECADKLKSKNYLNMVCPKCRREIESFERIYT